MPYQIIDRFHNPITKCCIGYKIQYKDVSLILSSPDCDEDGDICKNNVAGIITIGQHTSSLINKVKELGFEIIDEENDIFIMLPLPACHHMNNTVYELEYAKEYADKIDQELNGIISLTD